MTRRTDQSVRLRRIPLARDRAAFRIALAGMCLGALQCSGDTSGPRTTGGRAVAPAGAGGALAPTTGGVMATLPPPVVVNRPPPPPSQPSTFDSDGDGFSPAAGDCEDNSAQINPGAYDFPGNGHDEDCQGGDATAAEDSCEGAAIDSRDAKDAARALGLCRFSAMDSKQWGVISARYVQPDGKGDLVDAKQAGILPSLGGVKPRGGSSMLALSSGVARAPDQPGYTDDCDLLSLDEGKAPTGFPKDSPACPDAQFGGIYDGAALELQIRVPTNAKSFAFDSNFFTYEYPNYICQRFNDFFVAMVEPKPANLPDGNILFDQDGNPVSVNNSLLQVCKPGTHGGKTFACPQGDAALMGTGFDGDSVCAGGGPDFFPGLFGGVGGSDDADKGAAATGWLNTTAPVQPGSIISLRFAIWDSGDPALDSLALIDHFTWSVETPVIETKPILPE